MPALPCCDVSVADHRRPRRGGRGKVAFWFPGAHVGAVGSRPAARALGARGSEPDRGGLRPLGAVRASAAADQRLGPAPQRGPRTGGSCVAEPALPLRVDCHGHPGCVIRSAQAARQNAVRNADCQADGKTPSSFCLRGRSGNCNRVPPRTLIQRVRRGIMHAHASQRHPRRLSGHLIRRFFRLTGIDLRRCFCARCVAARSGLFRRTRSQVGRQVYADVHLLGIRTSHRLAFEMPKTAPLPLAGVLDTADARRRCQAGEPRSLPQAHVLRRAPVLS